MCVVAALSTKEASRVRFGTKNVANYGPITNDKLLTNTSYVATIRMFLKCTHVDCFAEILNFQICCQLILIENMKC